MRLLKTRWLLESLIVLLMVSLAYQLARPWLLVRWQRIEPGTTGLWKYDPETDRYPGVVYLPTKYEKDAEQRWPLLLYLHGSGERGGDPWRLSDWTGPLSAAKKFDLPMIVFAPHCPANSGWNTSLLLATLDELQQEFRVDTDRIYVGGYSMGGGGTWQLAAATPDRFAAILPVAGYGDPSDAEQLAGIPIWAFHGRRDWVVPVAETESMVAAIRTAGGNPKLTIFPYYGHWIWSSVFRDRDVYDWLLTFPSEQGSSATSTTR